MYIVGQKSSAPAAWYWEDGRSPQPLVPLVPSAATSMLSAHLWSVDSCLYVGDDVGGVHKFDPSDFSWDYKVLDPPTTEKVVAIQELSYGGSDYLFVLQGDLDDHGGGPVAAALHLWYSTDGTTWNEVAGLPANAVQGLSLSVTDDDLLFLVTLRADHSSDVWCPFVAPATPNDPTAGANYLAVNVNAPTHWSWVDRAFLGLGLGSPEHLMGWSVTDDVDYSDPLGGPWSSDQSAAGWASHACYGPHASHAFHQVATGYRLYFLDRATGGVALWSQLGVDYAQDDVLTGGGTAAADALGERPAFVEESGKLWCVRSHPTAGNPGYVEERVSDGDWVNALTVVGSSFLDAVAGPAPAFERTAFDNRAEINQCRIVPEAVDALEGDWCMLLGSEVFSEVDVSPGDKVQLSINWDFTANPIGTLDIYFRIRADQPVTLPAEWTVGVDVGGLWTIGWAVNKDWDPGWYVVSVPVAKLSGVVPVTYSLVRS